MTQVINQLSQLLNPAYSTKYSCEGIKHVWLDVLLDRNTQLSIAFGKLRDFSSLFNKSALPFQSAYYCTFALQLGAYMVELREEDTHRSFIMQLQNNEWIPVRQDGAQPCTNSVVLEQIGRHQLLHMVRLSENTLSILFLHETQTAHPANSGQMGRR